MPTAGGQEDADATAGGQRARLDLRALLSAVAGLLHETASRFEDTASRVAEIEMTRRGQPERAMIVTLQDFDRLQQELMALGDVLARCAAASDDTLSFHDGHAEFGHLIATVSVGHLRERLLCRLQGKSADLIVPLQPGEELF
jgi:hypothetical protein